jgi:hypothetical protein
MMARLKLWLAGVAAFVVTVFGVYLKGRSAGRQDVENEHVRRRVDAMKKAKDIRDEVDSDPYFVDRAKQWVRTNDKR